MAKDQSKPSKKTLQGELIGQLVTLSTSGFGLVAALAWNDTIQELVKIYIEPNIPGSGLLSRLIYAIIITILAVLITYQLSMISAKIQHRNETK